MRASLRAASVAAVLLATAGLGLHTAWRESLTADEPKHALTGAYHLYEGRCCLGWDNGPTLVLNALPLWFGRHPGRKYVAPTTNPWDSGTRWLLAQPDLDWTLWSLRVPSVLLLVGLGALVFVWSRSLYGFAGGMISLVLAAFSPNLIANGSLVTGDVHAAFFMTLACFAWARYHERPGALGQVGAGVCLGLALAAKFSALALLPSFGILALVALRGSGLPAARAFLLAAARTAGALAVAALVVWLAYGGVVSSQPANAPDPTIPLFADYAFGLHAVLWFGSGGWPSYLLGQYGQGGWWYYFPVALAAKLPLPALAALGAAVVATPFVKDGPGRREAFVWLPALVLFAGAIPSRMNNGVRYLLPVLPLVHVFAGRLARVPWRAHRAWRAALAAGAAWYVVGTLAQHPDHLAYFNEAAGGPARGWRILADSNFDWGQDLKELARWLEGQGVPALRLSYFGPTPPSRYGIHYQPLPSYYDFPDDPVFRGSFGGRELLAVSGFNLVGIDPSLRDSYAWLRDRRPVARPGWSIFVYDVTGDEAAHRELVRLYEEAGRPELAELERERLAGASSSRSSGTGAKRPPSARSASAGSSSGSVSTSAGSAARAPTAVTSRATRSKASERGSRGASERSSTAARSASRG